MQVSITRDIHYSELDKMSMSTLLSVLREAGMPLVLVVNNQSFRPTSGTFGWSDRGCYREFFWKGEEVLFPGASMAVDFTEQTKDKSYSGPSIAKPKKSLISFDESDKPRSIDLKHED